MKKKIKPIKAWGIYHLEEEDFADEFFETRKRAKYNLLQNTYHHNPLVMKEVLKNYKIIPVLITPIINNSKAK